MKNSFKISMISLVCVLGAATSGAYAAATVRSFGGDSYSGTASATAAKSLGVASTTARAGSVRMTPGVKTTPVTTSSKNNAATARLSIGKYLGGSGVSNGGVSIKNPNIGSSNTKPGTSGGEFMADLTAVQDQVKELAATVGGLGTSIDDLNTRVDGVQMELIPGDYIYIDGDEIGLDLDALRNELGGGLGREIELVNDNVAIKWRYVGDNDWKELVLIEDLRGPAGEPGESGVIDPEVLAAQVADAVDAAVVNFTTTDQVNAIVAAATQDLVNKDALDDYATKVSLDDFIKIADLDTKLDEWAQGMGGTLGRAVEMRATDTEIQWRYTTGEDTSWKTLIDLASLKGAPGETGPMGPAGTVDEAVLNAAVTAAIDELNLDQKYATQAQGALAETALQPGSALVLDGAPMDGKDYVAVIKNGRQTWVEVIK